MQSFMIFANKRKFGGRYCDFGVDLSDWNAGFWGFDLN